MLVCESALLSCYLPACFRACLCICLRCSHPTISVCWSWVPSLAYVLACSAITLCVGSSIIICCTFPKLIMKGWLLIFHHLCLQLWVLHLGNSFWQRHDKKWRNTNTWVWQLYIVLIGLVSVVAMLTRWAKQHKTTITNNFAFTIALACCRLPWQPLFIWYKSVAGLVYAPYSHLCKLGAFITLLVFSYMMSC